MTHIHTRNGRGKFFRGASRAAIASDSHAKIALWTLLLALGDNHTASFRIQPDEVTEHRYRVAVVLPGQSVTRVKSFAGRCANTPSKVRTAQR